MEKQLLESEDDFTGWNNYAQKHGDSWNRETPISYPCVVIYKFSDNPNGKDILYYEFVYPSDFNK